jgi:hypothetical protein
MYLYARGNGMKKIFICVSFFESDPTSCTGVYACSSGNVLDNLAHGLVRCGS